MRIWQPYFQNYILLDVGSWVCHEKKNLRFIILMTIIVEVGIGERVQV